eukprot:5358354-Amphidinium_carterae.1
MVSVWFSSLLDTWKIDQRPPFPGEYTQAGLLATTTTTRVLCNFEFLVGATVVDGGDNEGEIKTLK